MTWCNPVAIDLPAAFKKQIASDPIVQKEYRGILSHARTVADTPPLSVEEGSAQGLHWKRRFGDDLGVLAMAYLTEGDSLYLHAAVRNMKRALAYRWSGADNRVDLIEGHMLAGLVFAYDWLYHAIEKADRTSIRDKLLEKTVTAVEQIRT